MPLIYFSRISEAREEFFFAEIPRTKSQDHDAISISINQGEATSSSDFKSQYEKLPDYLKSCLDYSSFVTFKHSVDKDKLVRLLLSQGLVPDTPGKIMEEVAEKIVQGFICLGMLRQGLLAEGLEIDDNYRQVCLLQVEENDFVANSANSPVFALIYDDGKDIPPKFQGLQVHSLFIMTFERRSSESKDQGLSRAYMETVCSLKSLMVLDLEGIIECLPDEVENMVDLTYLGLYLSKLDELPLTLANLQKLQTLDIRGCRLGNWHELPKEALKIKQLRHLLMSHNTDNSEVTIPKGFGFGEMENLHTCDGVYGGGGIADELGNLIQLRKLGVKRVGDDHSDELVAAIMKMRNLISLSLEAEGSIFRNGTLFPEMEQFSPPALLQDLHLFGGLVDIPNWLLSMENLTVLSLSFSRLLENQISALQVLPKLKHLTLWEASNGKYMSKGFCDPGGFKELETLEIASSSLVEWTEIVNGAFPSLRFLSFRNCMKLEFLPEGLQNISSLQQLCIFPVYTDIVRRLYGDENYKIKHIQDVMLYELPSALLQ
ncbi:disease resistance protein RPM1-like [Euphorbia lathyris]|uniref:disease resistance protein RPM1-like n=1 Tax=Euphorbia lathyris TaxID=212925 RepID=UPI0033139906